MAKTSEQIEASNAKFEREILAKAADLVPKELTPSERGAWIQGYVAGSDWFFDALLPLRLLGEELERQRAA